MAKPDEDDPTRNANDNGGVPWPRLLWEQSYGSAAQPKAQAQPEPEPEPEPEPAPEPAVKK